MRVYAKDVKSAGYCLNIGARRWFARHNLDFREFMRDGMDAEAASHINDAFMTKVLEAARGRIEKETDDGL